MIYVYMYMYEIFGSNFHEFRLLYYFILVQILIVFSHATCGTIPDLCMVFFRWANHHGQIVVGALHFFPYAWTILINNIEHDTSSNYINPSFTGIDLRWNKDQ